MPHQIALTVRAPVKPGQTAALTQLLEDIDANGQRAKLFPFESLPVHFARFVVLDEAKDLAGASIAPSLIFLSDVDSPLDDYLTRLACDAGDGLDQVFGHCDGYPVSPTPGARAGYLRANALKTTTAYVNTVGRSVQQVQDEGRLRDAIEEFLDAGGWSGRSAEEIRAAVRRFVADDHDLRWALQPPPPPTMGWRMRERAHMITAAVAGVVMLPVIVIGFPFWLIALRQHERRDIPSTDVPDRAHLDELAAMEDILVQNQLTALGYVKPGTFRRLTLTAVLWILSYGSRHIYNNGNLAGIRTIHFARWVFLDDKRRLIFASNYDGSIESYMDDFIDKVAFGLNAAFSNGFGYPRTNWLIARGAKDEEAFKNYLRTHQISTQVWYSAYGDLTARNIADNAAIRAGLRGEMGPAQAEQWARRL
jgi:hypothetical protein